jgi:DDE superfamily endonuclease
LHTSIYEHPRGTATEDRHDGSRKKFVVYISMLWPEQRLMYGFYDKTNSTGTITHLEDLKMYIIKNNLKKLILIWDNASYHLSKIVREYIIGQKKNWLTIIHLPKKAPYMNPNERRVNQQIKADICSNRFYKHIEELKQSVSTYLDRSLDDGIMTLNMSLDLVINFLVSIIAGLFLNRGYISGISALMKVIKNFLACVSRILTNVEII